VHARVGAEPAAGLGTGGADAQIPARAGFGSLMASPFDHSTEMPFLPFWRIGAGAAFHAVFFSRLAGLKSSLPAFLLQSSDLVTRSPVTKSGDNSSPDERTVAILPAGREEARFLHQPVVELVGRVDPLGVLLARQEGVVEGTCSMNCFQSSVAITFLKRSA